MAFTPYKSPNASLELETTALKESDFVKAYLCFVVCAVIAGALSGAMIGGIIGGVWGARGSVADPAFSATVTVFSVIASLIVNYFVFRFFVSRFIVRKVVPIHGAA